MANLRKLEMEADVDEKNRRAQTMDDMDAHLRREIELLAMERQRLLLEEEIREVKVAKAKGWVINAKRRFPLGGGAKEEPTDGIELVKPADPKE
jgi:L-ribulose-5-phosphate 3-epimerase UlaE